MDMTVDQMHRVVRVVLQGGTAYDVHDGTFVRLGTYAEFDHYDPRGDRLRNVSVVNAAIVALEFEPPKE